MYRSWNLDLDEECGEVIELYTEQEVNPEKQRFVNKDGEKWSGSRNGNVGGCRHSV